MAVKRGFLQITQPTAGQTLASPVTIKGVVSAGSTVTVTITGATSTTVIVPASGTSWATKPIGLGSGGGYTVSATGDGITDSKDFSVR